MMEGFAGAEGTTRYAARFPDLKQAGHFRAAAGAGGLELSSIGLGTYLGETNAAADAAYTDAIEAALVSGVNLLDTAINYRNQRSERNIGAALARLLERGELRRDEVVVCTKAGYLPFDSDVPPDPRGYFTTEYVERGVLDPREVAEGSHCIAPAYLADQLERSRRNLGLATVDVFYLHNPETQLAAVERARFEERMERAFAFCEEAAAAGKLSWYGAATWQGFRAGPGERGYLSLARLAEIARRVGGDAHHFRFVQLPFSLAMPEAYAYANQDGRSLLEAAHELGMVVIGSATLMQAQLAASLPPVLRQKLGTASDAQTAMQFARSAPGIAAALVGMGRREHVEENVKLARLAPTPREKWEGLFERS